ncbi:MAG: hypothetical protein MSC53_04695 [Arcanobacterium sp.]|nr:hypothetical protein [Arcanobacterium sp.]MDY5273041.1 hypothetical protein [Arcanobacterium sp.]
MYLLLMMMSSQRKRVVRGAGGHLWGNVQVTLHRCIAWVALRTKLVNEMDIYAPWR